MPPGEAQWNVIESRRGWLGVNWRELWRAREILYFLIWRDVKIRYKQTELGIAWAVLQPLLTMAVFTVLFGRLAGLATRTGGVPYSLHVFSGLLPWILVSSSVTVASNALIAGAGLVTKIYFPRLLIPFAAVGAACADFVVSVLILFALIAGMGVRPNATIVLAPVILLGVAALAAGISSAVAALVVVYRDVRYLVPFVLQIWMFVTPIIYPSSMIPDRWRWLLVLNPLAGLIDGFRSALLGGQVSTDATALALVLAALVFVAGTSYYRNVERRFADII